MILTVNNQKGGVGKSTTVHALSCGLALRGRKVLALDLDPQSNLSFCNNTEQHDVTIYDVLVGQVQIQSAIVKCGLIDIVPSNMLLSNADTEFTQNGHEYLLYSALKGVIKDYDYIIIDTPPTMGVLTINALTAADSILIPMSADIFSLQGIALLSNTIEHVRSSSNPSLKIAGILLTRYSDRIVLSRDIRNAIRISATALKTKVFNTYIRESISVREAQARQQDIFTHAPKSTPTSDYNAFIDELLSTYLFLKGIP